MILSKSYTSKNIHINYVAPLKHTDPHFKCLNKHSEEFILHSKQKPGGQSPSSEISQHFMQKSRLLQHCMLRVCMSSPKSDYDDMKLPT